MLFSQYAAAAAFLAIAAPVIAQSPSPTQTVNSSQSSAFRSVLSTYSASFKASPQFSNIVINLALNVPASAQSSITSDTASLLPVPTGSAFNLYSFATDPPTTFPQIGWESYLSTATELRSSIDNLRTSAVLALATSAQSVLGTSASIAAPSSSSSSAAAAPALAAPTFPGFTGSAMGVVAGAVEGSINMYLKPYACALAAILVAGVSGTVLDLSTLTWTLSDPGNNVSVPAKFPSQAHLDLYAAGVITDPYLGLNDFDERWVAESNWTYTSNALPGLYVRPPDDTDQQAILNGPPSGGDANAIWLVFQGLDTFTTISLCNQTVASTNNQFRQFFFEVSDILTSCTSDPVLSINFGSAVNIVNEIAAQPGQETWPYGVELSYEFPNRQFMRKEQSDFGWDWGPAFAPAGPWQTGYMVQLTQSELYVRNALVDIYKQGQLNNIPPDQSQPWVVNASLDVLGDLPDGASLTYLLTDAQNKTVVESAMSNVNVSNGAISGSATVQPNTVDCWWPTGFGPQTLYNMTIYVVDTDGNTVTSAQRRVGFRTIVLNEGVITQDQLDAGIAPGNNWHFEVNGYEFYAKGSNFIPPDAFWPRVTVEKMQNLFQDVVDARQNMLRVWSSGAYSPDFIYDLADEMGILLWSEFEFGDTLYPVDADFLANVADEVNYQVRRVNYHPSLAFWAGGNELENLELQLVNRSAEDQYERYKNEYQLLFLDTIVPQVFGNTRSISYAPSSTSNGYISLDHNTPPYFIERYENLDEGSIYGETDYYNYDPTVAFDFASYPVGRFSNEFGYHSMPSIQSWQEVLDPSQWYFNSSVITLRNHHYPPGDTNTTNYYNGSLGLGEMTRAVEEWYPTPNKSDSVANFSAWCHATQVFQADYYTNQIQFYRRGSGLPQRTLGSLYWQLEDIWQAPTWASIEYNGRWKLLHYRGKDAYNNIIVAPYFNSTTGLLEVYVTSDLWSEATGTASATWYDWSGNQLDLPGLEAQPFTVGALNTTRVYSTITNTTLGINNPDDVVMSMSVNATGKLPNNDTTTNFSHSNWFHASALSNANLVDPGLTLEYDSEAQTFTVCATQGVASWVWLDYPAGAIVSFDDNGFWLGKGQSRTLGYNVKSDNTTGAWANGVTVQSLWNQTQPDLLLPQ
ncbi:MAG: hypothetical protein Q9162_000943 [Coniocarpon cinnabarinum]